MQNTVLAEQFAKGETIGEGSNMFIRDDTIYSFGTHFKIAIRLNPDQKISCGISFIYNSNIWGSRTSVHQFHVRNAINSYIAIPDCNIDENVLRDYILELKDNFVSEINDLKTKQSKLKTKGKRFEQFKAKIERITIQSTQRIKEVENFTTAIYGGQAIHFIKEDD